MKIKKTNALRLLDKEKIPYELKEYEYDEDHLSGEHVLAQVEMDGEDIYKTLVLVSDKKEYLVCLIPVLAHIDLKKLAKLSNHKKVEMIHQKELLPLTGYMRGGCSPIGMKKAFPIYIDKSMERPRKIAISAGKRGLQVILESTDLIKVTNATLGEVI